MEHFCVVKAKEMLELKEDESLPSDLKETLLQVNDLCV